MRMRRAQVVLVTIALLAQVASANVTHTPPYHEKITNVVCSKDPASEGRCWGTADLETGFVDAGVDMTSPDGGSSSAYGGGYALAEAYVRYPLTEPASRIDVQVDLTVHHAEVTHTGFWTNSLGLVLGSYRGSALVYIISDADAEGCSVQVRCTGSAIRKVASLATAQRVEDLEATLNFSVIPSRDEPIPPGDVVVGGGVWIYASLGTPATADNGTVRALIDLTVTEIRIEVVPAEQ